MGIFRSNRQSVPRDERASNLFLDEIAALDGYSPLESLAERQKRLGRVQLVIARNVGRMAAPMFVPGQYAQSVERLELVVTDLAMQRSRLAMLAGQDALDRLGGVDALFPAHPDYLRRKSWDAQELHRATDIASGVSGDLAEYLLNPGDGPNQFADVSALAASSLHVATLRTAKQIGVSDVDQMLRKGITQLSTVPVV